MSYVEKYTVSSTQGAGRQFTLKTGTIWNRLLPHCNKVGFFTSQRNVQRNTCQLLEKHLWQSATGWRFSFRQRNNRRNVSLRYSTTNYSLLPITKYERTGCGWALNIIKMHLPTTAQQHNSAWAPLWLVRSVNVAGVRTRKVLPQWPQTTLMPSGWMGRAGWAGCSSGMTITGLRLMMRLLSEETKKRTSFWL